MIFCRPLELLKAQVHKIRILLQKGFQPSVSSYYVLAHQLSQRYKKKKSGYVPFFNPLSLSDTDTIPTYKRVPKVVKFQISVASTQFSRKCFFEKCCAAPTKKKLMITHHLVYEGHIISYYIRSMSSVRDILCKSKYNCRQYDSLEDFLNYRKTSSILII